ncbi:CRAL-TRIO lipid binding domain [Arabidopsis thaliana x Arabidopsis arenosa]|uniref:CRAL-TRIO lipid binding domain n=1 Tax=Arabidopsis thaliana x Arabidopsis arenosa TaxID=1240361 RepID=A0A8T2BYZ8_9BRAS|nr:CRAL-TRIO lipid binding domain [Arabidopsis thaliana x Arabidopsis arenosa]
MAQEEIQKPAASITASVPVKEDTPAPVKEVEVPVATEKAVAAPVPEEKVVSEKEVVVAVPETEVTAVKEEEVATGKEILQSESFKEEGYLASELPEAEKNALAELKEMVREALNKREFTAPPPPPAPVKEEKVEEKKTEETEEKKEEVKTEEKSVEAETKTEEKSAAPATVETKKEENLAAPAPIAAETKKEETSVSPAPVAAEIKKEEKSVAPTPVVAETKKEEISAAPTSVETKPAAPATTETKVEEKVVPVETTPAAPVVTETEEEKATPVVEETKKEEKASASAPVKRAVSKFIKDIFVSVTTTEKKKEEEKPAVVTIEKAFAADQEEETKTVEATEESIVSITLPETAAYVEPEEVSIWGIPLLEDERSDVILLKFLRARDFKVKEAFTMLKNTVQWRKENNIDDLVSEDLEGSEFEKLVFTHGVDKQGHVVIYSSYGEFQNKEIFADKEKLSKFLKWRIQFQEKCVRSLDFSPEAKSSFVFVSDFRNAPGLGQRALWQFIKRAVKQFEDNYPEFVAKELFINVPWWYIPYYKTFGSIITSPRTRSKMVLSGPSKSAETIFKYVAPEVVPVKYGGLSKESPFTVEDGVTEAVIKSTSKYTIDLPATEGSTLSWELRVLGADVSYGAQFEPSNEASYTVIVSKNRKIGLTDEPVITDSFKASEPGKILITIDNQTNKKKKVLYRSKTQA